MADPRIHELARIITDHSTRIQEGDKVLIQGSVVARPLIVEICRLAVQKGADVITNVQIGQERAFLEDAPDALLDRMSVFEEYIVKTITVMVNIYGPENTRELSELDPVRLFRHSKAMEPAMGRMMNGEIRWCLAAFPTQALAQDAGSSLESYEDFVFGAVNVDYAEMRARIEAVKAIFDETDEVHIKGPGTDLRLRTDHRPGVVCFGLRNLPDGEVYYAPVEDATEGVITYEYPALFVGQEVHGARLVFKGGQVVEATARSGEEFLLKTLDTDPGARILGELGIGMNFGIKDYSKNVLFDEKIGGTVHLALGRAYPASGGTNMSAIHWDMVKDLRQGGEIWADGRLVQKDGHMV